MLLDLRVVLASCLAALIFLIAGFGLAAVYRTPFKPSAGYALGGGPLIAGPGLPSGRPLPVTMPVRAAPDRPVIQTIETEPAIETKPVIETIEATLKTKTVETKAGVETIGTKPTIEAKSTIEDILASEGQLEITGSVREAPAIVPSAEISPTPVSAPAVVDVPASAPAVVNVPASSSAVAAAPPPSAVMPVFAPVPKRAPPPPAIVEHTKKTPPRAAHNRARRKQHHSTLTEADRFAQPFSASARPAAPPKKKRHRIRRVKKKVNPPSNPFAAFISRNTATPAAPTGR